MPADLEAKVSALPYWRGKPTFAPLPGGLSNTAFVVDDGRERYVVRCGQDIPVHHVSRERERAASIAAHVAGLSPELVYAAPGIMVVRYIEGRTRPHERWSMEFVHDALFDGRAFRVLTVVDQYSRQSPVLEPAFAHSGRSVSAALERVVTELGVPVSITVDHASSPSNVSRSGSAKAAISSFELSQNGAKVAWRRCPHGTSTTNVQSNPLPPHIDA